MAIIDEIKTCKACNSTFSPKKGVSRRQWLKSNYCSRKCYSVSVVGTKRSQETKEKMRGKLAGEKNPFWGKKHSEETLKIISSKLKGRTNCFKGVKREKQSGENHWKWISDRSLVKKGERNMHDPLVKQWRKQVKDRDGWACRIADNNCDGRLEVHHILRWSEFPELRYQINNGITLCHAHHPMKVAEEKRLVPTFQELVSMSVSKK